MHFKVNERIDIRPTHSVLSLGLSLAAGLLGILTARLLGPERRGILTLVMTLPDIEPIRPEAKMATLAGPPRRLPRTRPAWPTRCGAISARASSER